MKLFWALVLVTAACCLPAQAQYYGNVTANPYLPRSAVPPPPQGYNNQFGNGSNSPGLYDQNGGFHGNLNGNQFDPDSVSNPYGRYGSQFSQDSVNNQFGQYGGQYAPQSPDNPYGQGLRVCGVNGCD